jgi:hypothetical protein
MQKVFKFNVITTVLVWCVVRTVPVLAVLPIIRLEHFHMHVPAGPTFLDYDDLYLISENYTTHWYRYRIIF